MSRHIYYKNNDYKAITPTPPKYQNASIEEPIESKENLYSPNLEKYEDDSFVMFLSVENVVNSRFITDNRLE